jgi:hypothetical protein
MLSEDWKEIGGSTCGMWLIFIGIQEELQTFTIISACAATIYLLFLWLLFLCVRFSFIGR